MTNLYKICGFSKFSSACVLWIAIFVASNSVLSDSYAQIVASPSVKRDVVRNDAKSFKFGKFQFVPSLLFKSTFDDNALYSEDAKRKDCIINVKPGIDFMRRSGKVDFVTGYSLEGSKNVRNSVQDFLAHEFFTELYMTPFGKRLFFRASEELEKTSEPADVEILQKTHLFLNEAAVEVGYKTPGEDLEFTLGYINNYKSYDEIYNGYNFYGNGIQIKSKVNIGSRYRFLPKTQAMVDFNYTRASQNFNVSIYEGDLISNGYRFMVGISGSFTRKLNLITRLGYTKIDFDISQSASDLLAEVALNYIFSSKTRFQAGYGREIEYSIFSPYSKRNNYYIAVNYVLHRRWKVDLTVKFDDIDYSGPINNGAGDTRDDFVIRVNLEGAYRIKPWLSILFGYNLQTRNSNLVGVVLGPNSADFTRNTYYLGLGFNYF